MPLLRFTRSRRSFPAMPAMLSSMPPIDTRQIERAVERGRARMESIAETISNETMSELLDDLRHEAAPIAARAIPIIERATGRRRKSRKPKAALAAVVLIAIAGIVAYLFWQRRDEEPAYLVHEPDQPDLTPAQTPPAGPSAPTAPEATDDPTAEPPARTTESPAPAREFAGAPHAIFGHGDRDSYEDRPTEGGRTITDVQRSTFAPTPVRLLSNARRSWPPR